MSLYVYSMYYCNYSIIGILIIILMNYYNNYYHYPIVEVSKCNSTDLINFRTIIYI